jgi:hypothetical protein
MSAKYEERSMEKQNVTLALPKETLRKAKAIAAQRNSSLSALLTQALNEICVIWGYTEFRGEGAEIRGAEKSREGVF